MLKEEIEKESSNKKRLKTKQIIIKKIKVKSEKKNELQY
jgi:hypothetical protein